jgi:hypothetical protein
MPIIEVTTSLRVAIFLRSESAVRSALAFGRWRALRARICRGITRSMKSSSDEAPTSLSMASVSVSSGPMWRRMKLAPGSSSASVGLIVGIMCSMSFHFAATKAS